MREILLFGKLIVSMVLQSVLRRRNSTHLIRIGAAIGPHDPYWVQVRETVYQRIEQLGASLVPLEISDTNDTLYSLDPASLAEELLAQELDAVVAQTLPLGTIYQLVYNQLPVVLLSESQLQHQLFCSPRGLSEAGKMAAEYIVEKIHGRGRVLCVGGMLDLGEEKGISRIAGFCETLRKYPQVSVLHCPTPWRYDQAYPLAYSTLRDLSAPVDAIFGISDSVALAGRDAARALGVISPDTTVVGINGDPLAIAAVLDGSFSATIETSAEDLGRSAVELAFHVGQGEALPRHYSYPMRLITSENAADSAVQKMIAIANLPSHLVGVNREEERHRLVQLQTSAAINQRVGSLLDRRQLSREIADLLRVNYGFDHVQFFIWSDHLQRLFLEDQAAVEGQGGIALDEAGLLAEAIRTKETIFIPDTRYSHRYSPDKKWPNTRSRVVMPIHLGEQILGLLDLHSMKPVLNLRWEIIGLQSLADQFAIALRNAELYSEALEARAGAERADQLKTRLLANVSHELRTPLNVILGYSQAALSTPNLYGIELPENLRRDLHYIYDSGDHLIRIINDLLDLSRAEIGALNVFPEAIDTHSFLEEVFDSMGDVGGAKTSAVCWNLQLPSRLPIIQADPVRLRQILLNLLSNAAKFTQQGHIILGADVEPPNFHIWVSDSGPGIPIDQQELIFEPFVTNTNLSHRREGVGLGLTITRRLVALHGGSMSLESQPEHGSTFHVYLPLPNLAGKSSLPVELGTRPALLLLSTSKNSLSRDLPEEVKRIADHQRLEIHVLNTSDAVDEILRKVQPVAIAWDMHEALQEDWNLIQNLFQYPQISYLPLILFGQETACGPGMGVTNILLKPFSGKKLGEWFESLRTAESAGPVLVVDDDVQARALYQNLIADTWPRNPIHFAENGEQAVEFLKKTIPSFVLLDLVMPKMDGFQVLEQMRLDQRTCKVPVVILSGKLLTFEDVARLNYANVVFQSKEILSTDEIIHILRQTFSGDSRLGQPTSLIVKQSLAYLHQNFNQQVSRGALAESVGVSDHYLTQIFHQEMGISPMECLTRLRIQKARELLRTTNDLVTLIAQQVGFDDPAYFSRVFRKITGISPQAYRKEGL